MLRWIGLLWIVSMMATILNLKFILVLQWMWLFIEIAVMSSRLLVCAVTLKLQFSNGVVKMVDVVFRTCISRLWLWVCWVSLYEFFETFFFTIWHFVFVKLYSIICPAFYCKSWCTVKKVCRVKLHKLMSVLQRNIMQRTGAFADCITCHCLSSM